MTTRLWSKVKVDPTSGCWIWQAALRADGYGAYWRGDRTVRAHRHVYELLRGAIPEGAEIDHLCRRPACVNPDHLEPVTHLENVRRSSRPTGTHCHNGHAFDEANTYHGARKHTRYRRCRRCHAARERTRRRKEKG